LHNVDRLRLHLNLNIYNDFRNKFGTDFVLACFYNCKNYYQLIQANKQARQVENLNHIRVKIQS